MKERKFIKHKVTVIQGTLGDMAIDQLGWLSQKEQDDFWTNHNKNIERLKENGEYLKPIEIEMQLEYDPLYDTPKPIGKGIESYRMTFLNMNN